MKIISCECGVILDISKLELCGYYVKCPICKNLMLKSNLHLKYYEI